MRVYGEACTVPHLPFRVVSCMGDPIPQKAIDSDCSMMYGSKLMKSNARSRIENKSNRCRDS